MTWWSILLPSKWFANVNATHSDTCITINSCEDCPGRNEPILGHDVSDHQSFVSVFKNDNV